MSRTLDLGSGVTLRFICWAPDRDLNPQYDGIPDVERWGGVLSHPSPNPFSLDVDVPGNCIGMVTFDGAVQRQVDPKQPKWTVESWDPLTISPSVLCACGFHGFIRGGRWVPA